jgi:hypothetical protein
LAFEISRGKNTNGSEQEELEELNQSLRNLDKLKDDAIAQLSDQLMVLSPRLEEVERR